MKRLFTTLFAGIALLVSLLAALPVTDKQNIICTDILLAQERIMVSISLQQHLHLTLLKCKKYHIHPTTAL